ncbi:glutamate-cysteine ligase family protein [Elongatibacter sediminis]|uniref:Glutamate-cysteine ligase family protein n=1 Tax=Elongatibacter sediminis TaxID=3119006 RepID=A0AAW9R7C9_9GAMM
MGEQNVQRDTDEARHQAFMRALLEEVRALEKLLESGRVETGIRRIGAEQEMFIVDAAFGPANKALEMLDGIDDERFTNELGLFNIEANLSPQLFGGDCLGRMEAELRELYQRARAAAGRSGCDIALVGILPSLTQGNLGLDSMVPAPRYHALNDAVRALRGEAFRFTINGIDQLSVEHDNVMLEACNTSFQVHFQVGPEEFARLYNIAQVVTAPLLAAAANSPILLGKRLWHETRIAVFQNSVDSRSTVHKTRGQQPRVHFGDHWVEESVTEIFKEDIARNRIILTTETEDDPLGMVERGDSPRLNALRLHNGTVYRWNRPCYGVVDNVAHLRIENRVIPSGPTLVDEMANAAFFFGMMAGMAEQHEDIRTQIRFEDVKTNFLAAAREGIRAQLNWFDDSYLPAKQLIEEQLIPLAREGLEHMNIDRNDIDRLLGVLTERVAERRTGSRWALESLESIGSRGTLEQRMRSLVSSMVKQQSGGEPISRWKLAGFCEEQDWRESYRQVGQFMSTDLFTVRPDDIVDFAATLMDWRHVRHVPVEDDSGALVGLVSHRALLRLVAQGRFGSEEKVTVSEIMNPDPVTVSTSTSTVEAIRMMREKQLACLPVLRDGKLVGLVTEHDLIVVSSHLLESYLADEA